MLPMKFSVKNDIPFDHIIVSIQEEKIRPIMVERKRLSFSDNFYIFLENQIRNSFVHIYKSCN